MPYFKKSSVLSEIGWTNEVYGFKDGGTNRSLSHSDQKASIPLRLSHICRNPNLSDASIPTMGHGNTNCIFELQSPDLKHRCLLRCADEHTTTQWFSAIHNVVHSLASQSIKEVNSMLLRGSSNEEVKHMGWLSEQVCIFSSFSVEYLLIKCFLLYCINETLTLIISSYFQLPCHLWY